MKRSIWSAVLPMTLVLATASTSRAEGLSLEDILNLKVTVASLTAVDNREAPGIISVITAEEIRLMGARDLEDVLSLVPGVQFNADVMGQTGISMRGLWAHEGKALLLWDGQPLNDLFYGNTIFGNHYPVDQIARIEIMRGPGSAVYGGNAELAVINVISKTATEIGGIRMRLTAGQLGAHYSRQNVSLQYGGSRESSEWTAQLLAGRGRRSDKNYTDPEGTSFSLLDSSSLDPFFLNLGFKSGNFEARGIVDRFRVTDRTGEDNSFPATQELAFDHSSLLLRHHFQLSDRVTLTPSFDFTESRPWRLANKTLETTPGYEGLYFDKVAQRFTGGAILNYEAPNSENILVGLEFSLDDASTADAALNPVRTKPNLARVRYNNLAGFTQGMWNTPIAKMTVGARFERHSIFGDSFVPRLAATKVIGPANIKILASRAFRAPNIENIKLNSEIAPERSTSYEMEIGTTLGSKSQLSLNLYDQSINRPIIYVAGAGSSTVNYLNSGHFGTRGAEILLKSYGEQLGFSTSYSYYRSAPLENDSPALSGDRLQTLGNASHKLALNASFRASDDLIWNSSMVLLGERWGYAYDPSIDDTRLQSVAPTCLVNMQLTRENLFTRGLELGVGVFNLLGSKFTYLQAYKGGTPHSPLPAHAREYVGSAAYRIEL